MTVFFLSQMYIFNDCFFLNQLHWQVYPEASEMEMMRTFGLSLNLKEQYSVFHH